MKTFISLFAFVCAVGCGSNSNTVSKTPETPERPSAETQEIASTSEQTPPLQPVPDTSIMSIGFERSGCGGSCPGYSIKVNHLGEVVFDGWANVKAEGEQKASIAPEKAQELAALFMKLNFFDLQNNYADATEAGGDIAKISMVKEDMAKAVIYRRDDPANPPEIAELERALHKELNAGQWIE